MRKIPKNSNSLFIVITLFTFLSLLLFWPIITGKVNLNGNLLVSFYQFYGENLPYKNLGLDQLRLYFPIFHFNVSEIAKLRLPLWNPYAFSGQPNIASLQSGVFYPLNILGIFLNEVVFWHIWRITPSILGALFTYLFLRDLSLGSEKGKLSKMAAIFGAITFGFGPLILAWGEEQVIMPHSIIWLPLILWSAGKFFEKPKGRVKYLTLVAFSITFSIFAGFPQTTAYMLIFILLWVFFSYGWRKILGSKSGWRFLTSFTLGILISAVQFAPSIELYLNSARSAVQLKETLIGFLLPLNAIVTFFSVDFFGNPATWNFYRAGAAPYYEGIVFVGVAALIFALYAIFFYKKDRHIQFWAICALVFLSLAFNLPTSKLIYELNIPILSGSISTRVLFVPAFCMAVLAAIGMNRWIMGKDKGIIKALFFVGVFYLLLIVSLILLKTFGFSFFETGHSRLLQSVNISLRNLIIPLVIFGVSSTLILVGEIKSNFRITCVFLIITVSFAHSYYFAQKFYSFNDVKNVFPKTAVLEFIKKNQGNFRSWGIGDAFLENNFATAYEIYWPEGYSSLNISSYAEFTSAMQGGNIDNFSFRADAGLGRDKTDLLFPNENRRKLIDMVGVRYVIAKIEDAEIIEKNNFKKVFDPSFAKAMEGGGTKLAVFENLEVMPRAFLASNYEGPPQIDSNGKTDEELQKERRKLIPKKLLGENFDFKNVLILESPSPISPQFGPGKAEIISYKPHEVMVKTESAQPKLLFLSDNYYPGWKAQVDGEETPILRANYTFRAVPLIPGEHIVRFYYDSDSFKLGLLISLASLVALAYLTLRKNLLTG